MSEYQYVAFRAVDRPLTDEELQYAESQSSRAEITRWSFTNEYHYGDFRGDAFQLLRRGYDVHLHYTNFGVRTVMMRLAGGPPCARRLWSQYVDGDLLHWKKDKRGPGGILVISPYLEPDQLEQIWEPGEYIDDVGQVRNELIEGDLRPLYAAWLCGAQDAYLDDGAAVEPSVPAGIGEASAACRNLLEFYDVDPLTLDVAGEPALPCPDRSDSADLAEQWVAGLPEREARKLLTRFLIEDAAETKAAMLATVRESSGYAEWPASAGSRTLEQLRERTEQRRVEENTREKARRQAATERKRRARRKQMIADPKNWLKQADKLVAERGTDNYDAAAEILAELGQALGDEEGERVVRKHAAHLVKTNPTLNRLKSSLRKRGLLPK